MKQTHMKGAVLVQVLVMGGLLLILVTLLVKAVNQHYHMGSYLIGEARETKNSESAVAAVYSAWAANAVAGATSVCSSGVIANASVACATLGTCAGCRCTVTIAGTRYPDVVGSDINGDCRLRTDLSNQVGLYSFP